MKTKIITVILFLFASTLLFAQEKWSLNQCIHHALKNNIDVQQTELQIQESNIQLNTAKNSRLPALSANLGGNAYFGRGPSRDGTYVDETQTTSSLGISFSVPVYEGSRIKNEIISSEFNLKSTIQNYKDLNENLSLNIVSIYMQILFSKELLGVVEQQLKFSKEIMNKNDILLENGKISEGEYYESVSLVAKDNLTVIESRNKVELNLLDMAHALNMPNAEGFDIVSPNVDSLQTINALQLISAESIYSTSVISRPSILSQEYLLKSYKSNLKITKSAYFPSISFSMGYNNSYYYSFTDGVPNSSFLNQMQINGSENIGLSINIPIFNQFSTRNQIRQANISVRRQKLVLENEKLKLYKAIELSHKNAETSIAKYFSSKEVVKAALIAFSYEKQKTETGRSTIFDFNDSKTRLIRAESDLIQAKYEFILNKMILDFYNGKPLTGNGF